MKRIFVSLAAATLLLISDVVSARTLPVAKDLYLSAAEVDARFSTLEEIKLSLPRIHRDLKSMKDISDLNVATFKEGTVVSCKIQGTDCRISYNSKGTRVSTIRYYSEDKLAKDTRHMVRSSYYDHKIAGVTEVNFRNKQATIVHLEGKDNWINVVVVDGEMSQMSNYNKQ